MSVPAAAPVRQLIGIRSPAHEEQHRADPLQKIVRMANQIGTFFLSKPHEEGVAGVAEHINKFWEARMRRHFFEMMEKPDNGFPPIVREAAAKVRRPAEPVSPGQAVQSNADAPGGNGVAMGGSKSEINASQG